MRHRMEKRKLGRLSAHRDAMLRNMVTSLLEHDRIETTVSKAKEVRRVADRMITLAKRGDLHAMRLALRTIRRREVAHKLFADKVTLFSGRSGGYTRILRVGRRPGDNSDMAIIELVVKAEKKEKKPAAKTAKKTPVAAAREAVSKAAPRKKAAAKKAPSRKKTKEGEAPAKTAKPRKKAGPAEE